jgi:membrane associated rhomboid family serine protease
VIRVSRYQTTSGYGIGYPTWTPAVRTLIITCVVVYFLQTFDQIAGGRSFEPTFGLTASDVTQRFFLWQLVTYIFLHGGLFHILFNMLMLWMFGSDLERTWGSRQFTKYFFVCGIGAAVSTVLMEALLNTPPARTIGASGATYGILLAYGMLFPNRIIYWIMFPIPAKWLVVIMGGIAFYSSLGPSSGVANIAHLGGMLTGFLYLKLGGPGGRWRDRYQRWRRERMRRKFDVFHGNRPNGPPEDLRWRRWK